MYTVSVSFCLLHYTTSTYTYSNVHQEDMTEGKIQKKVPENNNPHFSGDNYITQIYPSQFTGMSQHIYTDHSTR